MEDLRNPYAPPKSETANAPKGMSADARKVYSPAQGSLGTFLGGPLAGTYFVRANFQTMGDAKGARMVTMWGIAICAVILLSLPFLPAKMPGYILPIAYAITVRMLIEKKQFTKVQLATSTTFTVHSNWRVVGIALAGLVVFALLGVTEFLLMSGPKLPA
jgi:hypothetical protein